jgi:hypothetical protein
MGILLDTDVAVGAAQDAVHAGPELGRIYVKAAARFGFHAGFAVADQAVLVGGGERPGTAEAKSHEESRPNPRAAMSSFHHASLNIGQLHSAANRRETRADRRRYLYANSIA